MKIFKNVVMPYEYLGEKYTENASGKVSFSLSVIRNFCDTYTYIDYDMLTDLQKLLLKEKMIQIARTKGFPGDKVKMWDCKKLDIDLN